MSSVCLIIRYLDYFSGPYGWGSASILANNACVLMGFDKKRLNNQRRNSGCSVLNLYHGVAGEVFNGVELGIAVLGREQAAHPRNSR